MNDLMVGHGSYKRCNGRVRCSAIIAVKLLRAVIAGGLGGKPVLKPDMGAGAGGDSVGSQRSGYAHRVGKGEAAMRRRHQRANPTIFADGHNRLAVTSRSG